ncbi:MAG TPA: potassium channel family protein [Streptosporangiaceae bacterium]
MTAASLARRAASGGAGSPPGSGRFGLMLLVLISTYLLSAFSLSKVAETAQVVLFVVVLLLALRTSRLSRRRTMVLAAVAVIGTAAAGAAAAVGTDTGTGLAQLWQALVLLVAAVFIVRRVLARPTVTIQSIYGALSAYLIIGLMFAAVYAAMSHLSTAPFFVDGEQANTQTFQYFSFTTLTTLGYGDFTAAGSGGRAIAVMEAVAGQVFLATLVARLVAAFRAPAEAQRRDGAEAQRRDGKVPSGGTARRRLAKRRAAVLTPGAPGRSGRRPGADGRSLPRYR